MTDNNCGVGPELTLERTISAFKTHDIGVSAAMGDDRDNPMFYADSTDSFVSIGVSQAALSAIRGGPVSVIYNFYTALYNDSNISLDDIQRSVHIRHPRDFRFTNLNYFSFLYLFT